MGYLHIDNLYKNQDILQFKECYAMEKIHGTSARISWYKFRVTFFSGGENHEKFSKLFNKEELIQKFESLNIPQGVTVYGEAYGGKQQGMRDTYGDNLKFIVFDVKVGDKWLAVPQAEEIAKVLVLEFVHYIICPTEILLLDVQRNEESMQAIRNGMGSGHKREGIVLRPLMELTKNNGARIIAKHKRDNFRETKTKRTVPHNISPEKLKVLEDAKEVAEEWVTRMRLGHILGKIKEPDITMMREIIHTMIEDIKREGNKEIKWSKSVEKYIGKITANLTKEYFQNKLKENKNGL